MATANLEVVVRDSVKFIIATVHTDDGENISKSFVQGFVTETRYMEDFLHHEHGIPYPEIDSLRESLRTQ